MVAAACERSGRAKGLRDEISMAAPMETSFSGAGERSIPT